MKLWSNGSVPRSNGGFNPERRLLAAVLQRAITDYLTCEGEIQESAREWLYNSEDVQDFFGFSYICEALDFHKEELRKAILKQHEQQILLGPNSTVGALLADDIMDASEITAARARSGSAQRHLAA